MGGSSKSQQTTDKSTTVNTTTTTTIRDIGLTGKDAIVLSETVLRGLEPFVQEAGKGFNQLVGAAGKLVETSGAVATKTLETAGKVAVGEEPKTDFETLTPVFLAGIGAVAAITVLVNR